MSRPTDGSDDPADLFSEDSSTPSTGPKGQELSRLSTNSYVIHTITVESSLRSNEVSRGGCDVTFPVLRVEANMYYKTALI